METLSKCAGRPTDNCSKEESLEISLVHKTMIRRSWNVISLEFSKANSHVGGLADISPTDAFIEMFEKYPESRGFFYQFKETTREELQSNAASFKELKDHSVRVFQLVGKVIHSMDHNLDKVGFILTSSQIGTTVFRYNNNMLIMIFSLRFCPKLNYRQRAF